MSVGFETAETGGSWIGTVISALPALLVILTLLGILTRQQIHEAVLRKEPSEIRNVVTCIPDQTDREIGVKFIESPHNILIVVDRDSGAIRGIITLHDLIRAQASIQS